MLFAVGDRILFKRDKLKGSIIKINSAYKVTVLADNGFEASVSVRDLVKIEKGTDEEISYGLHFPSKDNTSKSFYAQKVKKQKKVLTIDLHIELLSQNFKYLDNYQILQIQLNECRDSIRKAFYSKITRMDIIHGIGEGVLKNEVHNILTENNLRFYLTNDGGVTEVYF